MYFSFADKSFRVQSWLIICNGWPRLWELVHLPSVIKEVKDKGRAIPSISWVN